MLRHKTGLAITVASLALLLSACSSSSTTSSVSIDSLAADCLQTLTTTVNVPLPMSQTDTADIYAYATAIGSCMQKLHPDDGIYCQSAEGSDGNPHWWCGKQTDTGTDDIDLSLLVISRIPAT